MNNPLPENWKSLIPQNRKGHWCVSDSGLPSEPYLNKNKNWAIIIWNRREECHYEFEFSTGNMSWKRKPWDNSGLYYSHQSEIVDRVSRLTTPSSLQ